MKKLIPIAAVLLLASCASPKTTTVTSTQTAPPQPPPIVAATNIVGDWDYTITGTPDGDFKGVLQITPVAEAYAAKMVSAVGEVPVEKFAFNKTTNKVTGEVPYNSYMVGLDATLAGDALKGTMFAGGMDFPFTATRKK